MSFTRCMYKYEVAQLLNIQPGTLSRWLNVLYLKDLQEIGYNKNQKYLTPKQLNYLKDKIDLVEPK